MTERPGDEPSADEATSTLPLFPLLTVLFPGTLLPLHIFEPRYQRLLSDRDGLDPAFGIVLTRTGREVGDRPEIYDVGTAATLMSRRAHGDGRSDIAVRGSRRFRVVSTDWSGPYLVANVTWLPERDGATPEDPRLPEAVRDGLTRLVRDAATMAGLQVPALDLPDDPTDLSFAVAGTLWLNTWERQALLEIPGTSHRLEAIEAIIRREQRLLRSSGATGSPIEQPGSRFLPN